MARDRKAIKKAMTDTFISDPNIVAKYALVDGLTFEEQFSLVSVENLWFDNVSFAIYNHEQIVAANAENSRPHTIKWYKEQAESFLDGLPLVWMDGQFQYDLSGVEDVDVRKIIARCAILDSNDGELVVKVARNNAGVIEPLTGPQMVRFIAYMQLIKDAGNILAFVNQPADKLKITLTVQVDVSIIDLANGKLLSTTEDVYPVKDAIASYLDNLEFNGAFVKTFFIDSIQRATGVINPIIDVLQWKYSGFDFMSFNQRKVPEAGYFKIDDVDLTINYVANDLV